jgi:hypothetical protein
MSGRHRVCRLLLQSKLRANAHQPKAYLMSNGMNPIKGGHCSPPLVIILAQGRTTYLVLCRNHESADLFLEQWQFRPDSIDV